jgi:hypothetical protein
LVFAAALAFGATERFGALASDGRFELRAVAVSPAAGADEALDFVTDFNFGADDGFAADFFEEAVLAGCAFLVPACAGFDCCFALAMLRSSFVTIFGSSRKFRRPAGGFAPSTRGTTGPPGPSPPACQGTH